MLRSTLLIGAAMLLADVALAADVSTSAWNWQDRRADGHAQYWLDRIRPPEPPAPDAPPSAPAPPAYSGPPDGRAPPSRDDAASGTDASGDAGSPFDAESQRSAPGGADGWVGVSLAHDRSSWWDWWQFHEEGFLQLSERTRRRDATDQATEHIRAVGGAFLGPSPWQVMERARPLLLALTTTSGDAGVLAAALEALSRLPSDADGSAFAALQGALTARDLRCVETAVRGLARTPRTEMACALLFELAVDGPGGRALVQRAEVPERVRCFALHGLAAHAVRNRDVTLRRDVLRVLDRECSAAPTAQPDLKIAALNGLGLLCAQQPVLASHGAERILELLPLLSDDRVRAQALIALGRIANALVDEELRRASLEAILAAGAGGGAGEQRAAAIALGSMSRAEDVLTPELRAGLLRLARGSPDPRGRAFAVLSLAALAAADPVAEQLDDHPIVRALLAGLHDGRGEEAGWYALAIGVLSHEWSGARRIWISTASTVLLTAFERTRSPEPAAACALALGLMGHRGAADAVAWRMQRTASPQLLRAGAPALGLMDARAQIPALRIRFADSAADPEGMRAAAIGLAMLGDVEVTPRLLRALQESEGSSSVEKSVLLCATLGAIGDGRALEPLLDLIAAAGTQPQTRAAAIRALGKICDGARRSWNSPLRAGAEYHSATETLLGSFGVEGALDHD